VFLERIITSEMWIWQGEVQLRLELDPADNLLHQFDRCRLLEANKSGAIVGMRRSPCGNRARFVTTTVLLAAL
jgi:hypothetical protein